MYEKNLKMGYLLDFYGDILTDRKRNVLDMYYNEDFSLGEIAEEIGISRQGVRDIIKKTEEELIFLEEKLGLSKKIETLEAEVGRLLDIAQKNSLPDEICEKIVELKKIIEQ